MIQVQGDPDSLKRGLLGRTLVKGDLVVLGGVQRRRDLLSEEFGDINEMLGRGYSVRLLTFKKESDKA